MPSFTCFMKKLTWFLVGTVCSLLISVFFAVLFATSTSRGLSLASVMLYCTPIINCVSCSFTSLKFFFNVGGQGVRYYFNVAGY